ncbi:caspase-7-like [Littorina saxatilis]|uniref:Caspase-3 n=1 Tax=Littorina saxatilis TaxID=31220 RepID=A0AAN9GLP8_9CAEN
MDDGRGDKDSSTDATGCADQLKHTLQISDSGDSKEGERRETPEKQQENAAAKNEAEEVHVSEGEGEEDTEWDETEGIKKALKKGYKAVKQFFLGSDSEEESKGDNETTHSQSPSPPLTHPAPVKDDAEVYDFTHPKRGRAVIINNETFQPGSFFGHRPGSSKDAEALKVVFKKLGFDVKCHNNLTAGEMKQALEKEAYHYDHQSADCIAVAILSHGDSQQQEKSDSYYYQKAHRHGDKVMRDLIFGVDGNPIFTESVMRTFQDSRCPGLVGKPRLFFLQACRGADYDDGVEVAVVPDAPDSSDDDEVDNSEETDAKGKKSDATDTRGSRPRHCERNVISPAPIFKDFLVMYATTPGHFAWRRASGTWFVQSLHAVFTKHLTPHTSLTQALTRVARMVAQGYESKSDIPMQAGKKQIPVLQSMLVKDVYFTDK